MATILRSFIFFIFCSPVFAGITIEPFASISSTKGISPDRKNKNKENETIKERQTYGLRFGIKMWRLFNLQLSVGQNQTTTTTKTQNVVDEYEEINFDKDLDMNTGDPDKEQRIKETQKVGRAMVVIDPSFSVFVLRAKAGVQATQREFSREATGEAKTQFVGPITYKPVAGAGAGIKFTPRTFFLAEYSLFFYKFPNTKIFEREVSVSFGVSI